MWSDRKTGTVKIGDQSLFAGHGLERRRGIGFRKFFQQRSGPAHGFLDLPEGIAAVEEYRVASIECRVLRNFQFPIVGCRIANRKFLSDGIQRTDLSERGQFVLAKFRNAAGQVMNGGEGSEAAFANQRLRCRFAQPANIFEAEAKGKFGGVFRGMFLPPRWGWVFFGFVPTAYAVGFILAPF